MKKLLAIAMLALPLAAHADEKQDEICKLISETARSIMEGRQEGIALSKYVDTLNRGNDPNVNDLLVTVAKKAYTVPRYSTAEYKERAAVDFENEMYLTCVR